MLRFVPEDTQCFVVMDLEWNQHASKPNHEIPHEIIEIGAVKLDRDLRILDEQQYIIKPAVYPVLDKHIREVTGIEPCCCAIRVTTSCRLSLRRRSTSRWCSRT